MEELSVDAKRGILTGELASFALDMTGLKNQRPLLLKTYEKIFASKSDDEINKLYNESHPEKKC